MQYLHMAIAYKLMASKACQEKGGQMEVMTDRQYDGILQMIEMIVNSYKDLDEAKKLQN